MTVFAAANFRPAKPTAGSSGTRFCVAQLMLKALTIVSDDEGHK
jgi:hypothetical protein